MIGPVERTIVSLARPSKINTPPQRRAQPMPIFGAIQPRSPVSNHPSGSIAFFVASSFWKYHEDVSHYCLFVACCMMNFYILRLNLLTIQELIKQTFTCADTIHWNKISLISISQTWAQNLGNTCLVISLHNLRTAGFDKALDSWTQLPIRLWIHYLHTRTRYGYPYRTQYLCKHWCLSNLRRRLASMAEYNLVINPNHFHATMH